MIDRNTIFIANHNAPTTVVAFSGLAPRNWMFEWVKTFQGVDCNFIGVKDMANCWYQRDVWEIAEAVDDAAPRDRRRVFIGASAGGFAALMFGKMLKADAILAFCPQSACGPRKRELGDDRWPKFCHQTPAFDIGGKYPNAVVHYAEQDELDAMHAQRIDCPRVAHGAGGHNVPDELKRAGLLEGIIRQTLRPAA